MTQSADFVDYIRSINTLDLGTIDGAPYNSVLWRASGRRAGTYEAAFSQG